MAMHLVTTKGILEDEVKLVVREGRGYRYCVWC